MWASFAHCSGKLILEGKGSFAEDTGFSVPSLLPLSS